MITDMNYSYFSHSLPLPPPQMLRRFQPSALRALRQQSHPLAFKHAYATAPAPAPHDNFATSNNSYYTSESVPFFFVPSLSFFFLCVQSDLFGRTTLSTIPSVFSKKPSPQNLYSSEFFFSFLLCCDGGILSITLLSFFDLYLRKILRWVPMQL